MKFTWTVFLFILHVGVVFCEIKCSNTDNCLCFPGREYEFQCPRNYQDIGGYVIHINEDKEVLIDCSTNEEKFDINLLPNITFSKMDTFRMRFCPLPQNNFKEILDWFSIKDIEMLQFGSSDINNITLIKEYFEGLGMLKSLVLNTNGFSDLDEDVFVNTPNLTSLELQDNNIKLKPNLFKNTPLLTSLDISQNKLESLPDSLFQQLKNLKSLHLWGNNLTTLNEFVFSSLSNLKSLELSANKIENISERAFKHLTNLVQINLTRNKLSVIPSNLFRDNAKLKIVRIKNNFILRPPDYLFSNLSSLEEVDLTSCRMQSITEHIFENSVNIKIILLERNNLNNLPSNLFKGLLNLKEIHLQSNNIATIESTFASLRNVEKLFLQNNLITSIEQNAFKDLKNLQEINLASNQIAHIHYRAFSNNEHLKKIYLAHNKYKGKNNSSLILLEGCHNLEDVNLSYNLITQVEDVITLINKVNLTNLDLSHNYITNINLHYLQALANKLVINLNYNNITTVNFQYTDVIANSDPKKDAFSNNDDPYSVIYLANNPLECDCNNYDLLRYFRNEMIPEVKVMFQISTENLTCANLADEPIHELSPLLLVCALETLTTDYNGCPEECSCNWRPFDKSIIIDCSYKNFTTYPEIFLAQIYDYIQFKQTEMHLEKNNLTIGPNGSLNGYDNITKLFLSNNEIRTIEWLPPKLEVLTLDHNQINNLHYEVLKTLNTSYLTNLTLNNNPWSCECDAENLTDFLRQHTKQVDVKGISCLNTGDLLINLNRNDLCHEWQVVYIIVIVMSIMLVTATSVALYYRYQTELKIWLYANSWCLWWVTEEELDKDKIYDAFISYSHKDEDFVTQNLLPVLENGPQPYKLCLHYRNWIPGEFISKQVTSSVLESRRTLVVLSPNFLESVWGTLEFRTAHIQAMSEGRARVIVVLYNDVDINNLDDDLKTYLKMNTYVKWGDPYFWNKLKYALPHSKKNFANHNIQKHANVMSCIDDKFNLVAHPVTVSPGSTPPVLTLDPGLLKKHPLNFVPSSEMDTPPAESGSLLTSSNL